MMNRKLCAVFCLILLQLSVLAAQKIPATVSEKINAALFEVVVKKPAETGITYEKDLPLEFLNSASEKDSYFLAGSAFLMNDGHFYSSADTFKLLEKSLYNGYYLRDQNGMLYAVGSVDRFSTKCNFVSFSVQSYTDSRSAGLAMGSISSGGQVFACGHITGTGKQITDGTVMTNSIDRSCSWQRVSFKAASVPETTGGPLVNLNGEVVGIITSFAETASIHTALFIEEAYLFPANTGDAYRIIPYALPNVENFSIEHKFIYEMKLPLSLDEIQKTLSGKYVTYVENIVAGLRKYLGIKSSKGFLQGNGSAEILCSGTVPAFPYIITYSQKGKWSFFCPENLENFLLVDMGSIVTGTMDGYKQALLTKPNTVSFETLFSSPKVFMDYVLEAVNISRVVGGESIAFTSFGEPYRSALYNDSQNRTWKIHYWQLPFSDSMAVTFSLLLPQGMYIIMDIGKMGTIMSTGVSSLQFMADCTYLRYESSVKNWKEYFEICRKYSLLYAPLNGMLLTHTATQFRFSSGSFDVNIPSSVMNITNDSTLCVSIGYSVTPAGFLAENRSIDLFTNAGKKDYAYMYVSKNPRPKEGASASTKELWRRKRDKVFPYIGKPYNQEKFTYYDEVLFPEGVTNPNEADSLFVFACELYGADRTEEMKKFAESLRSICTFKK